MDIYFLPYVYPISSFLLEIPSSREDFQNIHLPHPLKNLGGDGEMCSVGIQK